MLEYGDWNSIWPNPKSQQYDICEFDETKIMRKNGVCSGSDEVGPVLLYI